MASWRTVQELQTRAKLSDELRRTLGQLTPSRHFRMPTADVSSYVEEVLRSGRASQKTTHGFLRSLILQSAQAPTLVERAIRPAEPTLPGTLLSPGLTAAFEDAFALRRRTGGKDDYIGARHVIAVLLTSQNPVIAREVGLAMEPTGLLNLEDLITPFFNQIIVPNVEVEESLQAWAAILLERGFRSAASQVSNASVGRLHRSLISPDSAGHGTSATAVLAAKATPGAGRLTSAEPPKRRVRRKKALPPLPYQVEAIAGVRNDDPADLAAHDTVGDDAAALALARVIAARAFKPPLAVGVFGAWGSGKSFLMRRVQAELKRLREVAGEVFSSGVVEVKFNAWHYVDTDLWANLVGQIFETLEQETRGQAGAAPELLGQLTTARELTLASARELAVRRKAAKDAQDRLTKAEAALAAKRRTIVAKLDDLAKTAKGNLKALGHLKEDSDASKLVDATYGKPLADMAAMWAQPSEALEDLRRDGAVMLGIRRQLGNGWLIFWCVALTVFLASIPYGLPYVLGRTAGLEQFIAGMQPGVLALTGFLTVAGSALAMVTRKAVVARDAVLKAVAAYRTVSEQGAEGDAETLKPMVEAFEAARAALAESQAALDAAVVSQAAAAGDFAKTSPAERLKCFVRQKAALDGPYRSRQGLVGTIRRDFADLSGLMSDDGAERLKALEAAEARQQGAVAALQAEYPDALTPDELAKLKTPATVIEDETRRVDRIVLYIDDLDRCPAETVIEVLQAVHLLMAFPLFVVVVAVDVRWLEGALADRYKQFGGAEGDPVAIEYLEKIFQLAIWTQAFAPQDASDFVRRRFTLVEEAAPAQAPTPEAPQVGTVEAPDTLESTATLRPLDPPVEAAGSVSAGLKVTAKEVEFVIKIAGALSTTPRRLLRLTNSYQVARASLPEAVTETFVQGEYKGFAALLGLAVAWPDCVPHIVTGLNESKTWIEFQRTLVGKQSGKIAKRLEPWLTAIGAEDLKLEDLRPWIPTTLRFSFVGPHGAVSTEGPAPAPARRAPRKPSPA